MKYCKKCSQTPQNCECHIPDKVKNAGLWELLNGECWNKVNYPYQYGDDFDNEWTQTK